MHKHADYPDTSEQFYDRLAGDYHLLFADWRNSVRRQGQILDNLIRRELGNRDLSILDCTCGIGTQAIGLALLGHDVTGTDISQAAISRARREAASFGMRMSFAVADVRSRDTAIDRTFDAVISCDNSLPHLLTDADLSAAIGSIETNLKPGGLFLASIRDYDAVLEDKPKATLPHVFHGPDGRRIVFQTWDWSEDGRTYVFHLFILSETSDTWHMSEHSGRYRALRREDLTEALSQAGLSDIRWLTPEQSGYYQPIIVCRLQA